MGLGSLINAADDILALAAGLLGVCQARLGELAAADADLTYWRAADELRRRARELFAAIADEELDEDDHAALNRLVDGAAPLPEVLIARVLAEALDAELGPRLLPMFLGRRRTIAEGDPIPTPHPDWRTLVSSPNSDPWALDGRLDALPYLRLAGAWSRHVTVELDGDWRTWHRLPQLVPGDRIACALPNHSLEELIVERGTIEGRAAFWGVAPRDEPGQIARWIALLELARARGCRIVVFPELSATRPVVDAARRWLERQEQVDVVVAGSLHRPSRDGRWHNEAMVLVRGLPRPLRHRKFRAFAWADPDARDGKRHELLAPRPPTIRIWLSAHWAMTCLVCKDLVTEPAPRLLADCRANLVLVPTLSFKMDAFRTAAADVATWAQGIAVVGNAGLPTRPRAQRPPVVIGMPSQHGSLLEEVCVGPGLVIATLGAGRRGLDVVPLDVGVPTPGGQG